MHHPPILILILYTDFEKIERSMFTHLWLYLLLQYPVANEFWSVFDPIGISISTPTCSLLHSLTSPLKHISSFEHHEMPGLGILGYPIPYFAQDRQMEES